MSMNTNMDTNMGAPAPPSGSARVALNRLPNHLRCEANYTPKPATNDIIWVFLRDFYQAPDGEYWVEYQPAIEYAPWLFMPARQFRAHYRRLRP